MEEKANLVITISPKSLLLTLKFVPVTNEGVGEDNNVSQLFWIEFVTLQNLPLGIFQDQARQKGNIST